MRPAAVAHYLGLVLALLGALMLIPLGVSLIYGEHDQSAFLISALITASVGGVLWFPTRGWSGLIQRRESFFIVAASWLLAGVFGALPFMMAGSFTSYLDALFEAMGGFTTTAASVMADIESHPRSILFWRNFTQWLGGIGIIAIFIGITPMVRLGALGGSAMFEDEVTGFQVNRITPKLKDTVKTLWLIYIAFTLSCVALLLAAGMPVFDAVGNSLSAVSSGGYSPRNASIGYYQNPAAEWIIIVFMVLSGINFALYYLVWKGRGRSVLQDSELRAYLGILAAVSALVTVDLVASGAFPSLGETIRSAVFHVVSQQTGTGFATTDFDAWPWLSKSLILLVMFIGGSSGSTCGGLKVIRFLVMAKYAHRQLYSIFHPRVVIPLKIGGRVVPDGIVREALAFFVLFQSVYLLSTLALTALGLDLVTALSGVAATVGIVGPGLGLVGPAANYAGMPDLAKVVFILDMYVGRLDLWTVLVLLRPAFWREP